MKQLEPKQKPPKNNWQGSWTFKESQQNNTLGSLKEHQNHHDNITKDLKKELETKQQGQGSTTSKRQNLMQKKKKKTLHCQVLSELHPTSFKANSPPTDDKFGGWTNSSTGGKRGQNQGVFSSSTTIFTRSISKGFELSLGIKFPFRRILNRKRFNENYIFKSQEWNAQTFVLIVHIQHGNYHEGTPI